VLHFVLDVASSESTWVYPFDLTVEAPVLTIAGVTQSDQLGGDGDGIAEPGETIDITVRIHNGGHEQARTVSALLSETSPFAEIEQGSGFIAVLPEGGQAFLRGLRVAIDPECPEMSSIDLALELNAFLDYTASFGWPLPVSPFLDDCEADRGWTVSGSATGGAWERADPEGTYAGSMPCQPENDHTPVGTLCMVTGAAAGASVGDYDVDGGSTTLLSPVFDLSFAASATVEYWRWYTNDLGSAPGEDWWTVEVSNDGGAHWVAMERTQESAGLWLKRSFAVEEFVPLTSGIRFRFTAEDLGGESLVEAALDDFLLFTSQIATGVASSEETLATPRRFALEQNQPNPFNPKTVIRYALDGTEAVPTTLRVYDPTGRLVRTLIDAPQTAGAYDVTWDGKGSDGRDVSSGVYFYVLASGARRETRRMVLLK